MVSEQSASGHKDEIENAAAKPLRPGGRVYLVEYSGEDTRIAINPLHKTTEHQAIAQLEAAGFRWLEARGFCRRSILWSSRSRRPAGKR